MCSKRNTNILLPRLEDSMAFYPPIEGRHGKYKKLDTVEGSLSLDISLFSSIVK